jgi:hypothetical protein
LYAIAQITYNLPSIPQKVKSQEMLLGKEKAQPLGELAGLDCNIMMQIDGDFVLFSTKGT